MKRLMKGVMFTGILALAGGWPLGVQAGNAGDAGEERKGASEAGEEAGESKEELSEEEVHKRRMAQLRRLRDLAVENGRRDVISRVDGLIARELKRYSRKNDEAEEDEADSSEEPGDQDDEDPEED